MFSPLLSPTPTAAGAAPYLGGRGNHRCHRRGERRRRDDRGHQRRLSGRAGLAAAHLPARGRGRARGPGRAAGCCGTGGPGGLQNNAGRGEHQRSVSRGRGGFHGQSAPLTPRFSPAFLSPRCWSIATTVLETHISSTEGTQNKTSEVLWALTLLGHLLAAIGTEREFGQRSPMQAGGMPWERAEVGHSSPRWQKGLSRAR